MADAPTISVAFVLLPKFTLMALTGFIEALRLAADVSDRSRQIHCRWTILGPDLRPITSSGGVTTSPWETFGEEIPYDYVAVVGGLLNGHEKADPAIATFLKRAAGKKVPLIGLCTGSLFLCRLGLMKGRRCCVNYHHADDFYEEFTGQDIRPVVDALFVVDGPRITCAGGLASVDLAVHLLERHLGVQRAQKSIVHMIGDYIRPPSSPQPRFDESWSSAEDPLARRALLMMELHLREPLSIKNLAAQLRISVKKLERIFQAQFNVSPASYYKNFRLEIARRMLRETTRPVMSIAFDCGFGDISYFSRAFRAAYGASPRSYRRLSPEPSSPSPALSPGIDLA